ncbi:hypothetical protein ACVIRO_002382 [Rhizobium ruizarguesonis]
MTYVVSEDPNNLGNGDVSIRTDNGTLIALVYSRIDDGRTRTVANVIAAALNAAFCPGHTDMMVTPESLDEFMAANPLPETAP